MCIPTKFNYCAIIVAMLCMKGVDVREGYTFNTNK